MIHSTRRNVSPLSSHMVVGTTSMAETGVHRRLHVTHAQHSADLDTRKPNTLLTCVLAIRDLMDGLILLTVFILPTSSDVYVTDLRFKVPPPRGPVLVTRSPTAGRG